VPRPAERLDRADVAGRGARRGGAGRAGSGALADGRLLGETESLIAAFQAYVRERVEPHLDG
jgi:hypothetical protein